MNIAPYHLTEAEWSQRIKKAREEFAGNYVQCHVTRHSGAKMVGASAEIDFLLFGVRHDLLKTVERLQRGDLSLSEFGRLKLIALLERPTTYARVRIRARRLGLI